MMQLTVLGPTVCITGAGDEVVPAPLDRRLLSALAIDRRRTWSVDELAEAMWREPPETAPKLVRNRVSAVRARLGASFIESIADGYRLGSDVVLDVDALVDATRGVAPAPTAAALWRGEPFADVRDWPDAHPAIMQVRIAYATVCESAIAHQLDQGEIVQAISGAHALTAFDPYREGPWVLLARASFAAGHQRDALEACQRARSFLGEVGLVAGPALIETERRIIQHDPMLLRGTLDAGRARTLGPFVGRGDELARVEELSHRNRLVSLVGLGGVGKTRLVLELVRLRRSRDGASTTVADLTTAAIDEDVVAVVGRALGLPVGQDLANAMRAWAVASRSLLVLDNAEHVVAGVSALVRLLFDIGANVHVLVTSRIPLETPGEVIFALDALPVHDAIALFEARSVRKHDRAGIDRLCAAVGGLPLAIELAAGRADTMAPGELAVRLERDPATLDRPTEERQSSVNAMVEWSVASLVTEARALLADLALFASPFTFEACQHVARERGPGRDSAVDMLTALVRRGLVQVQFAEPARYRLLELVRRQAGELNTGDAATGARSRFVAWAASLVDATRMGEAGALVDDIPNLARAFLFAIEDGDVPNAMRIARALMPFTLIGRTEARGWAVAAVDIPGSEDDPLFERVAGDVAWTLAMAGEIVHARAIAARVIRVAQSTSGEGWARHALALIDADDAQDERALAIALRRDDALLELASRSTLALRSSGTRPDVAAEHARASSRRAGSIGRPWAEQIAAYTCGVAAMGTDPASSIAHFVRARTIADAGGMKITSAIVRVMLLDVPDDSHTQLSRDRDALERVLTSGIESMAPMVVARVPGDLVQIGRLRDAAEVDAFITREPDRTAIGDVRNMIVESALAEGSAAVGNVQTVFDVLRLLDEFR